MKYPKRFLLSALLLITSVLPLYAQSAECRCHSKNPVMKRMHETIGFKNCGNCHSKNENLMSGKSRNDAASKAALNTRFTEDKFCVPCHDSTGTVRKEALEGNPKLAISGTFFCPKDQLRYPAGTITCPQCGGKLINIDALTERSRSNPSSDICSECHMKEGIYAVARHRLFNDQKLTQCLDCHQGHDDCGGCHR